MKKRKSDTKSSIYAFLKSSGVLENGSHDEIQKVRKEYWREYKSRWRRNKRRIEKEISISLTQDEMKYIGEQAKRHKQSRTKFIKQACFAYINNSFIVPDVKEVKMISQKLSMIYNSIQEMAEENTIEFKSGRIILENIYKLEREILPVLYHPKSLEVLIKEHIDKNARNKDSIIEFINSL